jgi:CheY-like chemotaxis protein
VLLVEDEAAICRLAARALGSRGYDVLSARDGAAALRLLEQHHDVDLVVTDVVMPGMDGRRLGEEITARFPRARILYTSGYTDDMLIRRGLRSDQVAFIAKPYSPESLALAVRAVLGRPPVPSR